MVPLLTVVLLLVSSSASGRSATYPTDKPRINPPLVPYALEPLRWGSVTPGGWIKDWATAARNGLGSPVHAPFARLNNRSICAASEAPGCSGGGKIGNDVDGGIDGWRDGRPASTGFWDEDSAYVITSLFDRCGSMGGFVSTITPLHH
jgi:hypothetical protein